jgi:hypothetical protein
MIGSPVTLKVQVNEVLEEEQASPQPSKEYPSSGVAAVKVI